MSEDIEAVDTTSSSCCASCGIAENDDIKLKKCNGCYLVKYCSVQCQKRHRKQHKRGCKKRAAELRDELLFKQPDSNHLGDCPICMLPMPLDIQKSVLMACCSKIICKGCVYANKIRMTEMRLEQSCPFCRKALPDTDEEVDKQRMKRVEANDPFALIDEGVHQYMKGNYSVTLECYAKAARLGDAEAHLRLSSMYDSGDCVDKDIRKAVQHLEEASIGGHPTARYLLGSYEEFTNGNTERAVKHYIIAATQGNDDSMKALMEFFKVNLVEKNVLAATLRDHQAAVDAAKSPQREAAAQFYGC